MAIPTAELQSLSNKSIIELYSITLVTELCMDQLMSQGFILVLA